MLLIFLKAYKNTVQVPRHWSQKRRFLQNKRGILKLPFKLPDFIENTGVSKLRDPFEQSGTAMVRQKLRERINPRLKKMDISYEVLHDAFFKHQTKPLLTVFGDTYYEGRENEAKLRTNRPGKISEQLRTALGINEYAPPPWLINMQRYGLPPSYPNLKIPGLNCPLPEGSNGLYARPLDQKGENIISEKVYWGEVNEEEMDDFEEEEEVEEEVEEVQE